MKQLKCFCCKKKINTIISDEYIKIDGVRVPPNGFLTNISLYICEKCFKERANEGDFV